MMNFIRLFRIEMRNAWFPTLLFFAAGSLLWLLVPSYVLWTVLCFVLPFSGLVGKICQCQKDMQGRNMNYLFSLPVRRSTVLCARISSSLVLSWICYGLFLLMMHGIDRYSAEKVLADAACAEWYQIDVNVFFHFATDRTGMFTLTPQMVVHVLLCLLLFHLFVELFYVVREDCILPYGFCIILMIIFRFFCLSAKKGDLMVYFVVSSLPFTAELLYYGISFLIIYLFLKKFVYGCDYEYEEYESTTGNDAA